MAPNETLTLHFEGDLGVVVHPHACHESCELQGKERRFAIGRTEGVNVLTSRKQRVLESQLGIPNSDGPSAVQGCHSKSAAVHRSRCASM